VGVGDAAGGIGVRVGVSHPTHHLHHRAPRVNVGVRHDGTDIGGHKRVSGWRQVTRQPMQDSAKLACVAA
jgi:hypothetical protein